MKTNVEVINPTVVPIEEIKNHIKVTSHQIKFVLGDPGDYGIPTIDMIEEELELK